MLPPLPNRNGTPSSSSLAAQARRRRDGDVFTIRFASLIFAVEISSVILVGIVGSCPLWFVVLELALVVFGTGLVLLLS